MKSPLVLMQEWALRMSLTQPGVLPMAWDQTLTIQPAGASMSPVCTPVSSL
jgi:hypothetical protein